MQWFTVSRLSDHQELTPERFLLVRDVPIARTGAQLYHHNELPDLIPNADGWIHCDREPSEVFRDDSIASFQGKPITNDHPNEVVTPNNWNSLAIGTMQNVRRGKGDNHDVLIADLLFTAKRGIDLVRNGKRALSVGYEAYYDQTAPGLARQRNIIANHVALVSEGRCRERCTIVDGAPWYNVDAEFEESEHPRQPKGSAGGGEFTSGGGAGAAATHQPTKLVNGKRVTASGEELPDHVTKLKIPPAWTNVTYSPDPGAALLATGRDAKGRRQAVYSDEHTARQAAAKFERIKALNEQFDKIKAANEKARKDPETKEAADAAALIMHTGMRPGGEAGATKADVQGYGATTLEGRHVVQTKDGVKLRFIPGKKHGQTIEMPISDPGIAKMLLKRKQDAGNQGRLFDVNAQGLSKHVHSLGDFKTKDFRTHLGTKTAMDEIKRIPEPHDPKQYKRAVMMVAKTVSDKLGNTPTIALASYINPIVFAPWKESLGMTADAAPDDDDDWPDVHVGKVGGKAPDWHSVDPGDDDGGEDEEPDEFPPDIAAILGFNPMDEDAGDNLGEDDGDIAEGDNEDAGDTHDAACGCDACNPRKETNTMSKRSLRDLLTTVSQASFFAKDKSALDKLVKDAEEEGHEEPDGDEGKHASNVHVHIEHKSNGNGDGDDTDDALPKRVGKLEDSMKALDAKLTKVLDAVTKTKDKDDDKDDDKDKDTKDAKGDDDDDDDDKKDTKDIDAPDGETGALSAEKLAEAEPELMNADPALKVGRMQMGDAKFVDAINKGLKLLVKDIRARAEVLSPGIKLTMDAKPGAATQKALCDARRDALTKAIATDAGKAAVGSFTAKDIKGMSCELARTVFNDASERMKAHNNRSQAAGAGGSYIAADSPFMARDQQVQVLKGINKNNREYWAKQAGAVRH